MELGEQRSSLASKPPAFARSAPSGALAGEGSGRQDGAGGGEAPCSFVRAINQGEKCMRPIEAFAVLVCVAIVLCAVWVLVIAPICRGLQRLIFGPQVQPIPDREAARKLLETPVPSSDPKLWVRYKLDPEFVPAPAALIHVPSDAEHRATCARCQEEWKRSGRRAMPHATN